MALTGAAIVIANSSGLGQLELQPRGLDSDGTYLYALGRSQRRVIRITNLETFASEYASAQLSGNLTSLAFNDGNFYYADNNNLLYRIDPPFNTQASSTSLSHITNSGQIRSLCSDRTNLFGYDKSNSILYRIVDNGADISATVFATAAFPTGTSDNVLSAFYFEDAFYLGNRDDGNLWKLPDNLTVGSLNVVPTRVGNFTAFDASESNPGGAGVLGSEAYFLGDDNNSLYRFLQTTPTNNVPAFANTSYAFDDVAIVINTIVGTVAATDADNDTLTYSLTGANASDFAIDSNGQITVVVALTNSQVYSFNVVADDGTDDTSVTVSATAVDAPVNNAPAFANTSYTFDDVELALNTVVGTVAATDADNDTLSYSLTGTDADKFDIDSSGEITVAEALDYGETYSINVVADDGTDTTSVSVTINAETVSPRIPTFVVDSVTEDSATITITAGDDGGESVSDWEYELDGDGTWVSFGNTDLEQTISNLDPETAYSIKVRGINSEGDGVTSAAVTATTDAVVPLSIEVLDAQALTLDTDYDIDIEIEGNPDEVTAEGKWDGWYYDWDADTELLTISGNANTVLSDATWALTATKGTESVEEDVDYSVAPPAPVITEPQNSTATAPVSILYVPFSMKNTSKSIL